MTREEFGRLQIIQQFRLTGAYEKPLLPPEPPDPPKPEESEQVNPFWHIGGIWVGP